MSRKSELLENIEYGQNILNKLFIKSDKEIAEIVKELSIMACHSNNNIFDYDYKCVRTIIDEIPEKIEYFYYFGIRVDQYGITVLPEHGKPYLIFSFTKSNPACSVIFNK